MTDSQDMKSARDRSPSFPFIPLKAAVDRLKEFESKFGRQDVPADRVYLAWGMKGDTSQSGQTLAALKAFGLVDYKGSGSKRLVGISEDGRTYLRAQQDTVKQEVLRRVALKPKWIAHFWNEWSDDRLPDPIRIDTLVLKHKFNENAAPKFLRVYDETIAYGGVTAFDKVIPAEVVDDDADEVEEDVPLPTPLGPKTRMQQGVTVPLECDERVLTTGLLAKGSHFRLIVSGPVGPKEIDRLIRKLELDKEILADLDGEAGSDGSLS